jgi:hypothetical protein
MKLLSKLNLAIVWARMKAYINNVVESLDITGAEAKELLWTNPNPTAEFVAQTISLDLSRYDAVAVEYSMITTSNYHKTVEVPLKHGTTIPIMGEFVFGTGGKIAAFYRTGQVSDTGFSFSNGYQSTPSTDAQDQKCSVPCKIYGIRKVKGVVKPAEWTPADWVVERGGGGIYTWEKYNSGKCVLKAITKANIAYPSGPYLGGYESAVQTFTLPEGLFKTVELGVIGSVRTPNGAILENAIAPNVDSVSLWIINSLKQTTAIETNIKFIVEGTWK